LARTAGVSAITFRSVRDVQGQGQGKNTALLTPAAFKTKTPKNEYTWHLLIREGGISAASDFPKKKLEMSAAELNSLMA